MGKKTLVGGLVNDVLSFLGVGGHNETMSDISIQPLLTKGSAYNKQRRAAIVASDGDSWAYARAMQQSQRQYRRKYSAATIAGYGYAPTTNAAISVLDNPLVLSYIQSSVDASATEVTFLREGTSTIDRAAFYGLQLSEPTWSNYRSTLVTGGNNYRYDKTVKTSGTDLTVDLVRYADETIIEDLTNNYGYIPLDGTVELSMDNVELTGTTGVDTQSVRIEVGTSQTIEFSTTPSTSWSKTTEVLDNGTYLIEVYETDSLAVEVLTDSYSVVLNGLDLYSVGDINTNQYGDPLQFRTTMTKVSDGITTVNIFTDLQGITRVVPSALYDTQTIQVEYLIDTSGEYYLYLEDLDTVPSNIRTSSTLDFTPIITVKQENEILDQEDRNLQLMMRNVGVDPESIFPSLDNEKLNSAYLVYGVPFDTQDTACKSLLFDMFNQLGTSQGTIQVNISNLDMRYEYEYTKQEVVGSIGTVGTTTKVHYTTEVVTSSGESDQVTTYHHMLLTKQVTVEEYLVLDIRNMELIYTISGETNVANMDATGEEGRFLIPLNLLHALNTRDYYDVYEESLALISYAEETVYVEWYETMFFQFAMTIIATYFLGPWGMVLAQVIFAVVDYLLDALGIDGDWATAIRSIVAIVMAFMGDTSQLMYQLAGAAMSVMQIYFKDATLKSMDRYEKDMELIKELNDDVLERIEDFAEVKELQYLAVVSQHGRALRNSRMPFGQGDTPEAFYAKMSPDYMYGENQRVFELNWDSQNQMVTG